MMHYRIDAANRTLGRLATEVAILLRGKDNAAFDPAKLSGNRVTVFNIDRIRVTGKKMEKKKYMHHSGYHGGLKVRTLEKVMEKDSRFAMRHAVLGMLPKNRLRARMIKNLLLVKGEDAKKEGN